MTMPDCLSLMLPLLGLVVSSVDDQLWRWSDRVRTCKLKRVKMDCARGGVRLWATKGAKRENGATDVSGLRLQGLPADSLLQYSDSPTGEENGRGTRGRRVSHRPLRMGGDQWLSGY